MQNPSLNFKSFTVFVDAHAGVAHGVSQWMAGKGRQIVQELDEAMGAV
jgi:hypothetical protein